MFNKQYEELAKQLGDVTYKWLVLQDEYNRLVSEIKKLDQLAGLLNGKAQEKKPEGDAD
jgi:hypothetical protein